MWKSRLKPLNWRALAKEAAIVLVVLTAVHFWNTRHIVGGRAPDLLGQFVTGERFDLASRDGKPVVLHFWATWCGVCKAEQGNVESLAKGGDVVTIASSSGDAAAIERHLRGEGLTFPVVVDTDGSIARRYGVAAYPTTLFLDATRQIRFTEVGYTTTLGMRARRWFAGL